MRNFQSAETKLEENEKTQAFDETEEDITEEALKNIFKEYHLK